MSTPNTRTDAVVRIVEDAVVVAGTAVATWQASHSVNDVLTAVAAAPLVRSGIASALSGGRVSGVLLALKLVRQALAAQSATSKPAAAVADDVDVVARALAALTPTDPAQV